ncbi:MAG: (2Fe-2S)-binding protein [Rhodospirillaceae bacterium]|nr:MAG: (2Fe-2S)-binding protein [Rhodospirillaceae bacterium]
MPLVAVEPGGFTIQVNKGEALAEAAWRQGYTWPTTCWGRAECMACAVVVIDGVDATIPPEPEETDAMNQRLSRYLRQPQSRLACRLKFSRDGAVVEKKGAHPPQDPTD